MRLDAVRAVRGALLVGLALVIAKLFATGQMVFYMSPALDPLTALAAVLLGIMGILELRGAARAAGDESMSVDQALTFALVLVPMLLGLMVAPRALGSAALGGESASELVIAFASGAGPRADATPSAPIQDVSDLLAFLRRVGDGGVGQPVHAVGLVSRSADLAPNEFVLLRYVIAHCVADARPVGLLVVGPGAAAWTTDQWVEIDGSLARRERDGAGLVTIVADRIGPTDEPTNPYLQAF
jgi:uncharacterized repeat protein (TIGR03943 family)